VDRCRARPKREQDRSALPAGCEEPAQRDLGTWVAPSSWRVGLADDGATGPGGGVVRIQRCSARRLCPAAV
jgi:hypothetical protein